MRKMKEICFHGRGGQGAVTAAKVFAEGALAEGKHIQSFPEYGPERMGAPVRSFTRISDKEITVHSHVTNPEIVAVLDPTLLDVVNVCEGVPDGGLVVVNTPEEPAKIKDKIQAENKKVYTVDATKISIDNLGRNIPNTPMLGALVKVAGLISLDSLIENFKHEYGAKFSEKVIEGNVAAMKQAFEEVKSE
ncbi:MAG: pyruvate synthase [Candidatus Altiarchaeales archaeon]|nr:pyruvate synthase [Candidatus Altiarchaeales archaeon]